GARLDVADDIEMEMVGEVGPGAVVGDDFAAGVGLHFCLPLFVGGFEALFEVGVGLRGVGSVVRADGTGFVSDALWRAEAGFGIEPVVGIALRVDVTFGASHGAGWNFENAGETRGVEIAGGADLNSWVRGLRDERWQPADFEFEADDDEEVGFAELEKK